MARFLSRLKPQRGAGPTATQLRVGIFTVLALVAGFVIIVEISNIGITAQGYQIAVHFKDVAGLEEGATVQVSGVAVGSVTHIRLLPDQTVLAEASIHRGVPVYRQSRFIVSSTLTGQSTLVIRRPADLASATPLQPCAPCNPEDAPWGTVPPTFTDLISQSQEQLKDLSKTIAIVNKEMPRLAGRFDSVAAHADHLITTADTNFSSLAEELRSTVAELHGVVKTSGNNIASLTGNLNSLVTNNSQHVQQLINALSDTAKNLNTTMGNFASITGDPTIKKSLVETAVNFKDASEKLRTAAADLQSLTSDPNVQSQLRDTIANLDAVTARANDILGNFSNERPARQRGAAPAGSPVPQSSTQPGSALPSAGQPGGSSPAPPRRGGLRDFTLVEAQVRLNWSNKGGGPSSDLNMTLLPHGSTSVTFGANDLGYSTTYNALINKRLAPGFTFSGGALYSKLGIKSVYQPGPVGVDVRLYDPKHPTLDLYGDVRLARHLQVFYGERNVFGPSTRTPTFGLQANF